MTENKNHKVAVLGGGSFGTAIANMIATNNYQVTLWLRDEHRAQEYATAARTRPICPAISLIPHYWSVLI